MLLYIGKSKSWGHRMMQHESTAHWFRAIAKTTIAVYSSEADMTAAETKAIHDEHPLHNIMGNGAGQVYLAG